MSYIRIRGARVHNLKNVDVDIPREKFVVITGLSGSGKSSLAFDTIYAEGQRRFMESLSSGARHFLDILEKPDVDEIEGLPPTIAIDQRASYRNPRSTVGTMTGIYDYWRILFARIGVPHCFSCKEKLSRETPRHIFDILSKENAEEKFQILAPLIENEYGEHRTIFMELVKENYSRVRVDGKWFLLSDVSTLHLKSNEPHSIQVEVGSFGKEMLHKNERKPHIIELIKKALDLGDDFLTVMVDEKREIPFSQHFHCKKCGTTLRVLEPRCFSFNNPLGACEVCRGLGVTLEMDPELLTPNKKLSLLEGAVQPWFKIFSNQKNLWGFVENAAKKHHFSLDTPFERLKDESKHILFYGDNKEFPGVISFFMEKYKASPSEYIHRELDQYMREKVCSGCGGERLKKEYLNIFISGLSIAKIVQMDIKEMQNFVSTLVSKKELRIGNSACTEISTRLQHIIRVGLQYLRLDRAATTLSGGEAGRLRLATQLASRLVGVAYILDEPSVGLHPRDNRLLIDSLRKLCASGNSVLVVEHDRDMMLEADYLIDVGPKAGIFGGEIIASGSPKELMRNNASLTGKYLRGSLKIPLPKRIRKGNGNFLEILGARAHNLKNINVKFPLGTFIAVTGVSGSGKSSLIEDILSRALQKHFYRAKTQIAPHDAIEGAEHIDKVVSVDQSPIGRTPRSNPATYTSVLNDIRDFFSLLPEAKLKGFRAGHFSFNVKEGRCFSCLGEGMIRVDMQFLPDTYVECDECHGTRYNPLSLEVSYAGKNIAQVLEMTVTEALDFFHHVGIPTIEEKLEVLSRVGLGYLQLGQSATTLSGGEAQRIKLATELSRRGSGNTLYILDEPTTGLHFEDIKHLLLLLFQLVEKGNTVLVIEHNLDVIKCADWIIDLGPDGGDEGGYLVAEGSPKEIIKNSKSITGKFLKKMLD